MCDNKNCNKEAKFKVWIHRTITLDSYFCSNKCIIEYARNCGWKYSKKDNKLSKIIAERKEEINLGVKE